jgi:hypothetical protein
MNTYEIYTTKFSQIVQAKSAFLALQAFSHANPSEEVLCIVNEAALRKFLADRAAQKAQKEKEISHPTLF